MNDDDDYNDDDGKFKCFTYVRIYNFQHNKVPYFQHSPVSSHKLYKFHTNKRFINALGKKRVDIGDCGWRVWTELGNTTTSTCTTTTRQPQKICARQLLCRVSDSIIRSILLCVGGKAKPRETHKKINNETWRVAGRSNGHEGITRV